MRARERERERERERRERENGGGGGGVCVSGHCVLDTMKRTSKKQKD